METILSLSAKQRSLQPIDYMVSFSLLVCHYLIQPLIRISRVILLSSPCIRSPIGTYPSHIGISRIIRSSRIGAIRPSPIGTIRSSPIGIIRSSPIGIPLFRPFVLIQHLCSRCSPQSSRTDVPLPRLIPIGGASYFNTTPILDFPNSSQELLPTELG